MRPLFFLSLIVSMGLTLTAQAQVDVTSTELRLDSDDVQTSTRNNRDPLGLWPFFSVNAGLLDFNGEDQGDGHNLQLKGLMSFYEANRLFNFEGGLGLQNSDADGDSTVSGLMEAAARIRFASQWEAGPLANVFVGHGEDYGSSNSDLTSFVGANVLYDIPIDNGDLMRVGGRWLTDVGIPGEEVNIFMVELHYGLSFSKTAPVAQEQPTQPRTDHLARLAFENSQWDGPELAYSTLQVEPNTTDRNRVARLGRQLFEDNDLVTSIRVIGHADERGSTYSNQLLSRARANSVANALIFAGYPKDRVEVIAKGESAPAVDANTVSAWDRNRRVELEFKGVRDLARLRSLLQEAGIE